MKRTRFIVSCLLLAASLLGAAAVLRQHSVQTFGAVSGLPDPDLDPRPGGLAVNVALEQYRDFDPVFDRLAPFAWLRQTFPWDEIEPARGRYDWAQWDQIVSRAASRPQGVIAVLNFSPAWARGPDAARSGPPVFPDDFAAFASAFAARYADSIDVYQIWDEPNILVGWKIASVVVAVGILYRARLTRSGEIGAWVAALVLVWLTFRWMSYNDVLQGAEAASSVLAAQHDPHWVALTPK